MLIDTSFGKCLFQLYTDAIKADDTKDEFYVNRAQVFLKLERYEGTVNQDKLVLYSKMYWQLTCCRFQDMWLSMWLFDIILMWCRNTPCHNYE